MVRAVSSEGKRGELDSGELSCCCGGLQLLHCHCHLAPTLVLHSDTPGPHGVDRALAGGGHVVEAEDVTGGAGVEHRAGEDHGGVALDDPLLPDVGEPVERPPGLAVESDLVLLEDAGGVRGLHHQAVTW